MGKNLSVTRLPQIKNRCHTFPFSFCTFHFHFLFVPFTFLGKNLSFTRLPQIKKQCHSFSFLYLSLMVANIKCFLIIVRKRKFYDAAKVASHCLTDQIDVLNNLIKIYGFMVVCHISHTFQILVCPRSSSDITTLYYNSNMLKVICICYSKSMKLHHRPPCSFAWAGQVYKSHELCIS